MLKNKFCVFEFVVIIFKKESISRKKPSTFVDAAISESFENLIIWSTPAISPLLRF